MTAKTYAMAREVPEIVRRYLTPGKPYLVTHDGPRFFEINVDNGAVWKFAWRGSVLLNGADWTRLTEAEVLKIMVGQQHPNALGNNANSTDSAQSSNAPTIAVPADLWGDIMIRLQIISNISLYARESGVKVSINGLLTRIKDAGLSTPLETPGKDM